jgi:ubiquitin C-terminal hydrolase
VGFPEGKDLKYDLFAVDNHYGGLGGGHYTATAQNFFDQQWYDYNGKSCFPRFALRFLASCQTHTSRAVTVLRHFADHIRFECHKVRLRP